MERFHVDVSDIKSILISYLCEDTLEVGRIQSRADNLIRSVLSGESLLTRILTILSDYEIHPNRQLRYIDLLARLENLLDEIKNLNDSDRIRYYYSSINGYVDIHVENGRPDKVLKEWLEHNRPDERFYTSEIKDMINEFSESMVEEYGLQKRSSRYRGHRNQSF